MNTAMTPGIAEAISVSMAVIDAVGDGGSHVVGDRGADERHIAGDAQVVDVATAVRDQPWVLLAYDPSAEDAAGHVTLPCRPPMSALAAL